jgi:selenocysteine-specific elongation factor
VSARHFIVATAGHVDHGKSALVKALTGTDPDRLPEEKTRGITLDLGFAHLELPALLSTINYLSRRSDAKADQPSTLSIGIVDVPGHEDFVKNMIAGVGSIDLALFVVAADDGWMPQTEEHLQILSYLGVTRAVVALTKADLGSTAETIADVRKQLTGTSFERAPIVETSTVTGDGLKQLRETLTTEFSSLSAQRDLGKPRLFVDRVFSLRGVGTVVTGTLVGGKLERGQEVIAQPRSLKTRIRTIQSHNREQERMGPGTRCALNLADVATDQIARGDVVTISELGESTSTIDVLLTRSTRPANGARLIKNGASVYLHHGTTRVPARATTAHEGDVNLAQLRLDSPIFAFVGDRFVLRDPSERQTLAGGVILDVQTGRKRFREPAQRAFLAARAKSPNDPFVAVRSELRRDGAREDDDLLFRSNFSADEISGAIEQLIATTELVRHSEIVAETTWWAKSRRRVVDAISREHAKHPQLAGVDLAQLRSEVPDIAPKVFDAVIVDLGRDGYTKTGNLIKRSEHRAALPPDLAEAANRIRHLISEKPFDPPARKQIAPDASNRQALKFLIEHGEVIEVADVVLSKDAFTRMKAVIADFITKNGPATVSQLRQALGTSRRVIVPLLELLDRHGFTRRVGDDRKLAKEPMTTSSNALS